jgi:hypothetical protein
LQGIAVWNQRFLWPDYIGLTVGTRDDEIALDPVSVVIALPSPILFVAHTSVTEINEHRKHALRRTGIATDGNCNTKSQPASDPGNKPRRPGWLFCPKASFVIVCPSLPPPPGEVS